MMQTYASRKRKRERKCSAQQCTSKRSKHEENPLKMVAASQHWQLVDWVDRQTRCIT